MALSVPNPSVPTNGQSLDATPLLANLQAVYQAVQSFDASQIAAGTLTAAAFNASINPNTLINETTFPFVSTGLVWSTVSGLNGTMTSGVLYFNGIRVSVNSVASNAFTASKDTYIDIDVNGNITYQAVTNNAASPAITANSIRVAIVITNGSAITVINQGSEAAVAPVISSVTLIVCDSLGNLICPRDPNRKLLGLRVRTTDFSTTATTATQITGLSVPVIVPAGRRVKLIFSGKDIFTNSAGVGASMTLWEGTVGSGTQLSSSLGFPSAGSAAGTPASTVVRLPASASQTYNAALHSNSPATSTIQAAATDQMSLIVELE